MARHKNPGTEELLREQAIYGNIDKDQLEHEQQITRSLAHVFKIGIKRMEDIVKGKNPSANDSAAVSAFRAVADVYQAKKRIDEASVRANTIATSKHETTIAEKAVLADVLKSFTPAERKAALEVVETADKLKIRDAGLGDL